MTGTMTCALAALFGRLSLLAVGGVITVLPEMQRAVASYGWADGQSFAAMVALSQAAPGPNMLIATLVGLRAGGVPGALVATAAMIGPSSALAFGASRAWTRFRDAPWRRLLQRALVPVTVGLVGAAALTLALATATNVASAVVTALSAAFCVRSAKSPLWMLAAGGTLGAAGLL